MSPRKISRASLLRVSLMGALALGMVSPASAGVGRYLKDRVNDFTDIFRLRVGEPMGGKGYGAKVRATALAQVGYVHFDGHYSGMDRRGFGILREQRTEGGVSLLYWSNHRMHTVAGNEFLDTDTLWSQVEDRRLVRNLPYWDDGRRDLLSVGAEIATPLLAVDIAVNPTEAIDFVVGFFTLDPFRDDMGRLADRQENRYRFPQTDPEPDMDALTRALRERLEAEQAERARLLMERTGQLDDRPDDFEPELPADVMRTPGEDERVAPPSEIELNTRTLDEVDEEGEVVEFRAPVVEENDPE